MRRVLAAAAALAVAMGAFGPIQPVLATAPANDDFANATVISSLPFSESEDASNSTNEPGEPSPSCASFSASTVWFAFTPPTSGIMKAFAGKSGYQFLFAVYRGSSLDSLEETACGIGEMRLRAEAGVTYYFQVLTNWLLDFRLEGLAPPPPNDDIDSATVIEGLPFVQTLDVGLATTAPDDPDCYGGTATVWYSFSASADARIAVDTAGSTYNTVLAVYTGERGSLEQIACNDNTLPEGSYQARLRFSATAGVTYYVMAAAGTGYASTPDMLDIAVRLAPPPPTNDDFDAPLDVTLFPYTSQVDTTEATTASDDPLAPDSWGTPRPPAMSVWYAVTPQEDGIFVATTAANYPVSLCVYTGSRELLTLLGSCSDKTQWSGTAGVSYYILGYDRRQLNGLGTGGQLTLTVTSLLRETQTVVSDVTMTAGATSTTLTAIVTSDPVPWIGGDMTYTIRRDDVVFSSTGWTYFYGSGTSWTSHGWPNLSALDPGTYEIEASYSGYSYYDFILMPSQGSGVLTVVPPDTEPPVLSLPDGITAEAGGPEGSQVEFEATANDLVDGVVPVTCSPASGSWFPLGLTTVTCGAIDAASNVASGSFVVDVVDTTAPAITLPDPILVDAPTVRGAPAEYAVVANDVVDGPVPVTCTPESGSTFPLGATNVHCTATDAAGNTAEGDFTVYVRLLITKTTKLTRDYDTTLVIGADRITLDCAGHTLTGSGLEEDGQAGILLEGRTSVTVKGCQVTGFGPGIKVSDSSRISLAANTATENWHGFLVERSTTTTLLGNRSVANNEGITIGESQQVTLKGNRVEGSTWPGVNIRGSTRIEARANTLIDNGGGLELYATSDSLIVSNDISQTRDAPGIQLNEGSSGNVVRLNTVEVNAFAGIALLGGSTDNRVEDNTASRNGAEGFLLVGVSGNTLTNNTANHNESYGINIEDSDGNTLTGNTTNLNGDGIAVAGDSSGNVLTGNTANENRSFGIAVFAGASSNQVIGNTANRNLSCGLAAMSGAVDNLFRDNTALNTIDGMDIWDEMPGLNTWENNRYKTICTGPDC